MLIEIETWDWWPWRFWWRIRDAYSGEVKQTGMAITYRGALRASHASAEKHRALKATPFCYKAEV